MENIIQAFNEIKLMGFNPLFLLQIRLYSIFTFVKV